MDSASIRARIAELTLRLDRLKPSEEMSPAVRAEMAATLDAIAAEAERNVVAQLQTSTDTDLRDEGARFFRKLSQSNSWLEGRDAFSKDWIDNAAGVASSLVLKDLIVLDQNRLRDPEAFAGIRELCESGRMDKARRVLKSRLRSTTDPVARQRIQETLKEPRNFLAPLKGAPAMVTYNGIGTMLLGKRALKPDGTFIATLYLVFVFIPLLPLRSYLVRRADGNNWLFLARAPLGAFAFWWRRLVVIGPIVLGLGLLGVDSYNSSPSVRENAALAEISSSLDRKLYSGTLRQLSNFFPKDPVRQQKADQLARTALIQYLATVQDAPSAKSFVDRVGPALPNSNRGWVEGEVAAAAERAFETIRAKPDAGPEVARFLEWMGASSKELEAKLPALSIRACESIDDPRLIARAIEIHCKANVQVTPFLVKRLGVHLVKNRHETWDEDAVTYLSVADPSETGPVLDARLKNTWIGAATDTGLARLPSLPEPLRKLIDADREAKLEPKIALLEKAADATGLEEPRKSWHRLGVARRLARAIESHSNQDPVRFPLAKALPWAMQVLELDPTDVDSRMLALRALITDGEFEKADTLATPALKEFRVAYLAGVARARLGRLEEAAQLLRPIVERDFAKYVKAVESWNLTYELRSRSLWNRLERGDEREFVKRLNRMPKDTMQAAAQAWVDGHLNADPQLKALRRAIEELSDVQPAAYELAMVELALGRVAAPGPARSERLGAAEKLFREMRKTGSDHGDQDLHLAQVCVWLGKESEAKEIFDRIMKSGELDLLIPMAQILRELGRPAAARAAYELAYEKGTAPQKMNIAVGRALAADYMDDKLAWLEKGDRSNSQVAFMIDETRADMMVEKGDFEAAAELFKRVVAHHAKLPEHATNLNNGSLSLRSLAAASGDLGHLAEALKLQKRSCELDPQGGIALGNYIQVLELVGAGALAGSALKVDVLHDLPETNWFEWVSPQPSPAEWAGLVKAQPELRRAAELGANLVVLSSDNPTGYHIQRNHFIRTRDADSLRRLRESVEAAPPAMAATAAHSRDLARGIFSDALKSSMRRILPGRLSTAARAREAKHGPTLAYALTQLVAVRIYAARMGIPEAGVEACERELEEAIAAFDGWPTRRAMAAHRMDEAAAAVARNDADFARWIKEAPGLSPGTLLPFYVRKNPAKAEAIRARPEFVKAGAALDDLDKAAHRPAWLREWFWLETMNHPAKGAALKRIRDDALLRDSAMLDFLLDRESPSECVDAWLSAVALGDVKLRESVEAQAKKSKLFPAFFSD